MTTDLTFITNENNQSLKDRFNVLIQDARFFDCLVGYFYTSGFYAIHEALAKTEKIRILIGISTDRRTYDLITNAQREQQLALPFPPAEARQLYAEWVEKEMEESPDDAHTENGVTQFIAWIRSGKLEIKVYPSQKVHANWFLSKQTS